MKKRLLSLLLAVVLCIGLLPVGALAADGDVTVYPDVFDEDGDVVKASEVTNPWFKRAGPVYSGSEGADTLSGQYYIVQNDVTIKGNLTVDGSNGGLVLCAGATLTIEGALILSNNNDFHIYGETTTSGNTGKLVINNNGDGAAIQSDATYGGSLVIHSGKLEINSASGSLVKNVTLRVENTNQNQNGPIYTVMKATRTDASGSKELKYEDWAGLAADKTDLTGSTLVIEYCEHDDYEFIPDEGSATTTHHMHCKACGFTWTSDECFTESTLDGYQSNGETGHTLKCICSRETTEPHNEVAPGEGEAVPTLDGTGHVSKSCVCGYTSAKPEAHTYTNSTNGSCDKCGFTPFMSDSKGNLYEKEDYEKAFEKAANSDGAITLTLVSEVTGEGANIWTKSIEFDYPGKSVTLKMNNVTLSSTGEAALLVSGGTLIIEDNATLEGAKGVAGNPSTPAVKVTGGSLTFKGTVNATGGSGNSSAAPAIEVTGGKVIFEGAVTATGGLRGQNGNPMTCEPAIKATSGELDFKDTKDSQVDLTLYGGLTMTGDAKLTHSLTKGSFYSKPAKAEGSITGAAVSAVGSNVYKNVMYGNVNKLLADKHVFVKIALENENDNKYLTSSYPYLAWDVTIEEHEHEFDAKNGYECVCGVICDHSAGYEKGKCKTCGKPCSHLRLGTGDRDCLDCGQRMIARIITKNNEGYDLPTYYSDLPTALNAAKNGEIVTLLDNIDQSNKYNNDKTACLTGDNKTVTLNLNGKNITDGWIYVGRDQDGTVINSSRLNITGSGSFDGMIGISAKGTLDLSGWDGGTIKTVDLSKSGNDECTLIVGENVGTINTLSFYNWPSDKISNTKLTGGTYGSIPISMNSGVTSISFSDLLASGYAFQYTDGSGFLPYDTKALYANSTTTIRNIKVVKCTTHVDAKSVDADGNITDGTDNHCDYCNTDLDEATVATLTVGGKTYFYTDLPSALKAASDKGGTVQLQQDVTGLTEKLDINHIKAFDITLDLNGHTISGTVKTGNTLLAVSTFGTVTICDTSSAQTGKIVGGNGGGYAVYVSDGKLIITGGTFEGTDVAEMEGLSGQAGYSLGADGSELVTINGGTFNSAVDAKDKLTVSGGTFKKAVTISARGATITGGTFEGAFTMSAQPDVFSGGMFKEQASFSNVSNILTGGTFEKGLSTTSSWPGLASLLKRNYKYKTTGGWHYLDAKYNVAYDVTVAEVPIHSPVSLIAYPGSKEYGKSQDITLSASCGGSAEDLYVGWFLVHKDGTQDLVSNGGKGLTKVENKSATYTLPAGLAIGRHTYRVFFCDKNVQDGENTPSDAYIETADITVEITKINLATANVVIEMLPSNGEATYVPTSPKTGVLIEKVTVNGRELTTSDYSVSGDDTAEGVGEYKLTIRAAENSNYTGEKEFDWKVVPYTLLAPVFVGNQMYTKTYDGTTNLPEEYTFQALFPDQGVGRPEVDWREDEFKDNYEVTSAGFVSPDAGENKPINQTITLKNENFVFAPTINIVGITTTDKTITYKNFTLSEAYPTLGTTFNIKKATMPDFDKEVTLDIINDLENTYTIDLPDLPALESPRTYGDITYTVASQSLEHGYATLGQPTVKQVDGKYQLCLTVPAVKYDQETSIGTILVKVTTTNYNDVVLTVNLQAVNKRQLGMFVSVATDPVVYGMTLGDIKLSAEATDGGQVIPGTIAWEDPLTTVPAAGRATYRWTFTPDDTMHYLTASNTITFLVDKATPTGAPTYTAITTGGKTLADAALTANASWPSGTVQWVDKDGKVLDTATTEVKANTAYQWKFTPDSKNYNPIEGSITLYYVSTGGGSTTYPVSTPSKTENGSVSVSPKNASRGDTVTIAVKPNDGYVLDDLAVTDKNGNDLKLTDKGNGKYTFTMPAGKVEVKASFAEEAETSPFADVATNAYYYEAVKWAAEQGITGGIGNNLFGPNQPCTRAQIVTFLWRAAGSPEPKDMSSFSDVPADSYYAKAVAWAVENGITTGTGDGKFSPDATCTRAQMAAFLCRLAGGKAEGIGTFTDVSADAYYAEAVQWAVENGITDGVGDNRFAPDVVCTRGQMVTFLYRFFVK